MAYVLTACVFVVFNSSAGTSTFSSCKTSDAGRWEHGCEENADGIGGDACSASYADVYRIGIFIYGKPTSESNISA